METSVVIPTYKRTIDLKRCLEGLSRQILLPNEVIIVVRDTDFETKYLLENINIKKINIKSVIVSKSGVVSALNEGVNHSKGDIIAFLDDDAVPSIIWLEKIVEYYKQDTNIGGVGGRDLIFEKGVPVSNSFKHTVGKLQWFGRVIGNHHLGTGGYREVDVLKGVNMSFRREAIGQHRFDNNLKGTGAQVGNELAFCLLVKKDGWRLIYDPDLIVEHYPAVRHDEDKRKTFNETAYYNAVFNDTYIIASNFNSYFRNAIFYAWSILLGTSDKVGLTQWMRLFNKRENDTTKKFIICQKARLDGIKTWHLKRKVY